LSAFLEKSYNEVQDNIKFSEAKNAALITLNSALITLGSGAMLNSEVSLFYRTVISIFVLLLVVPLICSIFSFRASTGSEGKMLECFYRFLDSKNQIPEAPKKYLYYAFIHKYFNDNPVKYLEEVSPGEYIDEKSLSYQMARQIVDFSEVAWRKFILFNIAIKIEITIFFGCSIVVLAILITKCF